MASSILPGTYKKKGDELKPHFPACVNPQGYACLGAGKMTFEAGKPVLACGRNQAEISGKQCPCKFTPQQAQACTRKKFPQVPATTSLIPPLSKSRPLGTPQAQ